jgi:hypothetical protein
MRIMNGWRIGLACLVALDFVTNQLPIKPRPAKQLLLGLGFGISRMEHS